MDEIYRDIYSRLYDVTDEFFLPRYAPDQTFFTNWVFDPGRLRRSIDTAELSLISERKIKLRPDAKFFLFVNLWQMVVLPIQLANRAEGFQMENILASDIELLLKEASVGRKVGDEISGHAVLDALSTNWKRLKLSGFKLWES